MSNLTSTLTVALIDDVSKPARTAAQAMEQAALKAREIARSLDAVGATPRLTQAITKLGASKQTIESVANAWKDYARAEHLAADAGKWTAQQAAGVKAWERTTIGALRAVEAEQRKYQASLKSAAAAQQQSQMAARANSVSMLKNAPGASMLGFAGLYGAKHVASSVAHTYREFDKERRYGKAVMGLTDDEQAPLIKQAIHGGATSKYNDIQWLEAQRELAARGLNADQVRAITEASSKLGMAMGTTLPEAAKLLEGGMFGFGKDTSTFAAAIANAKRTADLQVKANKIGGMTPDDIRALYKFGATPFRMSGLSEEKLLAFGAVGKKANMGGDEMGTAARALSAAILKPTAGARVAMMASGLDYSKYQTQGAKAMNAEDFAKSVAQSYGVALGKDSKAALQKVFDDKAIVGDAAKFMPKIMQTLADHLGGDDAKSKKSIAGMARNYRDASMGGVNADKLFDDMIQAMRKSPALANAIFGSKQGARVNAALGDPAFEKKLDELLHHSDGYADKIADERMAGFDGAVSRFEGAIKNLETAAGRAVDNDGKGGALTSATDMVARAIQGLAELPASAHRAAIGIAAFGTALAGVKTLQTLLGGFGLAASATALDGSAAALTLAATKLAGGSLLKDIPGGGGLPAGGTPASKASKAAGAWKMVKGVLRWVPYVGFGYMASQAAKDVIDEHYPKLPESAPPQDAAARRRNWRNRGGADDATPATGAPVGPLAPGAGAPAGEFPAVQTPAMEAARAKAVAAGADIKTALDVTAAPTVDTGSVTAARDHAVAAGADMKTALDVTAAPVVDTSSIQAAIAMAHQLTAALAGIPARAAAAARGVDVAAQKIHALGASTRGHFTTAGVQGE
jgi:TP901 family phage tail tape measure protein